VSSICNFIIDCWVLVAMTILEKTADLWIGRKILSVAKLVVRKLGICYVVLL
jgi:hypothetical protein